MARNSRPELECQRVELDGVAYVILQETAFERLCQMAGIAASPEKGGFAPALDLDRASVAEKLSRRRRAAGLSQAELARRAGIRPETLNRIERGHTTPDFATVRKLAIALGAAEGGPLPRKQEPKDADS